MPNWCENQLTIKGSAEAMRPLRVALSSTIHETPKLKFNALLPLPEEEKDNWYEWHSTNWGTKWDIDTDGEGIYAVEEDTTFLEYQFETAWAPPIELLKNISTLYPGVSFTLAYIEPGMCFAGLYAIEDGEEKQNDQYSSMEDVNWFGEDFFGFTCYEAEDFDEEES